MYSYAIRNIKSFKDSGEIVIKPLTIFVGKNSSGKSSLMRFPIVMKQTVSSNNESPIVFCGNLVDYGSFNDVINRRKSGNIEFDLTFDIKNTNNWLYSRMYTPSFRRRKNIFTEGQKATITVKTKKTAKKIQIDEIVLSIDDKEIFKVYKEDKKRKMKLFQVLDNDSLIEEAHEYYINKLFFRNYIPVIDFEEITKLVFEESKLLEDYGKYRIWDLMEYADKSPENLSPQLKKMVNILRTIDYVRSVFELILRLEIEESMRTSYIGPFRESPARIYRDLESQSRNVGVHGENISTILIRDYQKKKELIGEISKWLKNTMGYSLALEPMGKGSGYYQIFLEDINKQKSNIMDVGYGISQVLPIVTQILRDKMETKMQASFRSHSYTYIEQPELHLHPAAQSELAILFAEAINESMHIIVETHSEHFIRKLQALIADKESSINKDMVKIYYVDENIDGYSTIKEMKLRDDGRFEEQWPSGFFDKAHELALELLKNNENQ